MLYTVLHLHVDIIKIYSVMYITPYPNDNVIYIYITFMYCVLLEDG